MLGKVEFLLIFNVILLYLFVFHAFCGLNVAKKREIFREVQRARTSADISRDTCYE